MFPSDNLPQLSGDPGLARLTDELLERLASECDPEIESLLAAHPEYAERLRRLLPSLAALAEWRHDKLSVSEPAASLMRTLGDFRIHREIGRGGMGVVYEATQISLGRRVALKVLPFAAMLDYRQLQRFKHEASAAAILHHPNIVGVHCVGEERGVYYYAMELIEGRSLAEVIHARSQEPGAGNQVGEASAVTSSPARHSSHITPHSSLSNDTLRANATVTVRDADFFSSVARMGIQAAEALEHAHQHGIVHRDVKPSNLLVDASGHLWVTDFGLARIETAPDLTMTGDLLGTLRYMSPEQADGKPMMVDHHSDIYSLGATLYELATDRPVVRGQERAAILREIAETEPAHPRTFTPGMPLDLETILLKTLAKEPAVRYDSAQALADDLRRFLEHKPVLARRATLFERASKWSRRHRGLVRVGMAALAIITIVSTVAAIVAVRGYQAEVAERKRAEENFRIASDGFDELYNQFIVNDLKRVPNISSTQRALFLRALRYYERLSENNATNINDVNAFQKLQTRVGNIHQALGNFAEAHEAYQKVIDVLTRPSGSGSPETLDNKKLLATALLDVAQLRRIEEDPSLTVESMQKVVRAVETLHLEDITDAESEGFYATALDLGGAVATGEMQLDLAEQWLSDANDIRRRLAGTEGQWNYEHYSAHAETLQHLAELQAARGNTESALSQFHEALVIHGLCFRFNEGDPTTEARLRDALAALGHFWLAQGRTAQAIASYDEAIHLGERLAEVAQDNLEPQLALARLKCRYGIILCEERRYRIALEPIAAAASLIENWANRNEYGADNLWQTLGSKLLNVRIVAYKENVRQLLAEGRREETLQLLTWLKYWEGDNHEWRLLSARVQEEIGRDQMSQGASASAIFPFREALLEMKSLVESDPDNEEYKNSLDRINELYMKSTSESD